MMNNGLKGVAALQIRAPFKCWHDGLRAKVPWRSSQVWGRCRVAATELSRLGRPNPRYQGAPTRKQGRIQAFPGLVWGLGVVGGSL